MDFDLTDEQRAYRETVIEFAQRELDDDDLILRDSAATFSRDAWKRCADFGIQGLAVPRAYGGSEAGALTTIVAMEALGWACKDNGLIFSMNAQMWAVQHPLARFGTEAQKRRYLPGLCDGSLVGGHGMSEPGSGSDAFSLATTVVPDDDGFRLNGSKTFTTNGPIADVFLVFATSDRSRGFAGLHAFLVERGTPGFSVGPPLPKMGLRTCPMSELFMDDCVVPAGNLVGQPKGGMAVFSTLIERERSMILASTLGTMQRNLERSVGHARERRQFGQPIGKFQAVAHRLVEMKVRIETARLLLYRLGWLIDQGRPSALDSALAKLYVSECFVESSLDALQVHGGYGYLVDCELERDVRDAVGSRLYSGTSEIQKNLAARLMGL